MIYGSDLSYVHHLGFTDLARAAGTAILSRLHDAGITSGLIVDLACGSGVFARQLTDAGFDVLGVDISGAMIDLARKAAPTARFVQQSLHDVAIPPCAAVTIVGEGLTYLPADDVDVDLTPLFRRVRAALSPGGLLIFDAIAHSPESPMDYSIRRSGPDWQVEARVSEDTARHVVTRHIRVERRSRDHTSTAEEVHHVRTFEREPLVSELESLGFGVDVAQSYDAAAPPMERRFVCFASAAEGFPA
jgi:SAM-dependent methyltransferase